MTLGRILSWNQEEGCFKGDGDLSKAQLRVAQFFFPHFLELCILFKSVLTYLVT